LETNWFLPTALGTFRPTCLAPLTMIAGDMKVATPVLIVGFASYLDFSPSWIAANLEKNGIPARGILIDLPSLKDQRLITTRVLAQLFDKPEFRAEVAQALKLSPGAPAGPGTARIGFPAVLGLDRAPEALHDLEERLGVPVFEIPGLPPSVPGIRLHNLLVKAIEGTGVRVFDGMQVTAAGAEDGHLVQVWSEAAARRRAHRARNFVLATGGILGGGSRASYDGSLHETVFHLPVRWPSQRSEWLAADFLAPTGHPIFRSGLPVNASFQPVDGSGQVLYKNLWATGASLAGCDPVWERSLEGIALATGYIVGERIEI
jgi:glycerol-3-phosphate dehydrogenase subunit B